MKRWPIIRHVRWWWWRRKVYQQAHMWAQCGIGTGHPNHHQLAVLKAIWEGKR